MSRPLDVAREAAAAALRELDIPEAQARALSGAMHLGERVIELVADEYRDRACHPGPWAAFHEGMRRALPRWRWAARLHHRRMARRYRAMLAAGTHLTCSR